MIAQLVIGGLHALWAARIWWPIADELALKRAVVGVPSLETMPDRAACAFVAVALVAAALWPVLPEGWFRTLGLAGLTLVYLARGIGGYLPFMARVAPEEPFRSLNLRYYNPLCIALGLGNGLFLWAAL
ncbi:MAG: DUF3995 domain-containing protein [Pseudomonadota bacterium]